MPTNHKCTGSDHISRLAARARFRRWQSIWENASNATLRTKRQNPNMLFKGDLKHPGDVVVIPDREPKQVAAATNAHHPHLAPDQDLFLHIRILKDDFSPVMNAPYELAIPGQAKPLTGTTDSDGHFQQPIPRDAQRATLTVRVKADDLNATTPPQPAPPTPPGQQPLQSATPIHWELKIGKLNPIREQAPDANCVSGVQARLNNLAIDAGPVNGVLEKNAQTDAAIKAFQQLFQTASPPTGVPDLAKTQQKLFEVHDRPGSPTLPPAPPTPTKSSVAAVSDDDADAVAATESASEPEALIGMTV